MQCRTPGLTAAAYFSSEPQHQTDSVHTRTSKTWVQACSKDIPTLPVSSTGTEAPLCFKDNNGIDKHNCRGEATGRLRKSQDRWTHTQTPPTQHLGSGGGTLEERDRSTASGAEWQSVKKQLLKKRLKLLTANRTRQDTTKFCRNCTNPGPDPTRKILPKLLDLEYQARRAYIDSDIMKEQDRPTKVHQAFPCFREVDQSVEDPNTFLQARPLFSPVVAVCEPNCTLAIGSMPVLIFPKEDMKV
ncbi:uncharacterized protein V6R79_023079 [Siganus canaliculatus]